MQTKINKTMAFPLPGNHGNGQPNFSDPYIAGAEVTFGGVAALKDGKAVPYSATATTPIGIFVNPNEHILWKLPEDKGSIKVPAGETVGVAKAGSWYVPIPEGETEHNKWVAGAKLKYDSTTYGLVVDTSSTVAEILMVEPGDKVETVSTNPSDHQTTTTVTYTGGIALIRFL